MSNAPDEPRVTFAIEAIKASIANFTRGSSGAFDIFFYSCMGRAHTLKAVLFVLVHRYLIDKAIGLSC